VTLPDADAVAARAAVNTNDPRAAAALEVALSWARVTLARAPDDPLDDLNPTGDEAVLGAAADFLKLPAAQAALLENNDVPSTLPFDIGRRWETLLARGNKHLWALR
jgi:hypothetical protein